MSLEVKNITKSFGEQKVLNGISLVAKEGHVYTIVGGNGSGKTTLINIISGFLKADSGSIWYKKSNISEKKPFRISKLGISRTFQDLRTIKKLTVEENILLSLKRQNSDKLFSEFVKFQESDYLKAHEIIEQVSLLDVKKSLAQEISFGQQKLLTIGCCIANESKVLLLDEPAAGLDDENTSKIAIVIRSLSQKFNKTIIQIEHNQDFIRKTTNEIIFLFNGESYFFNEFNSFINSDIVKNNYLN